MTAGLQMLFPDLYLAGHAHLLLRARGTELTRSLAASKPEASNRLGTHVEAAISLTAIWRWQSNPLQPLPVSRRPRRFLAS